MEQTKMSLLPETLAICRLEPDAAIPFWAGAGDFTSVTSTTDELTIVCSQDNVPQGIRCDRGWRALKVEGPLDLSLTGILSSLAAPLAQAGISLFAVSTFDTDYILVKENQLQGALEALSLAGHHMEF